MLDEDCSLPCSSVGANFEVRKIAILFWHESSFALHFPCVRCIIRSYHHERSCFNCHKGVNVLQQILRVVELRSAHRINLDAESRTEQLFVCVILSIYKNTHTLLIMWGELLGYLSFLI